VKRCFKCGIEKPMSEFYRHPLMADGHLGKCKECAKRDVTENRRRKMEYYHEYDCLRANRPRRKAYARVSARRRRQRYPEKNRAYLAVARAIKNGLLVPEPCEVCGSSMSRRIMVTILDHWTCGGFVLSTIGNSTPRS